MGNYCVDMISYVGKSGVICDNLENATRFLENDKEWYWAKITNEEDGSVISVQERPYFVTNCRVLTDGYTGKPLLAHASFKTREEAEKARINPYQKIYELRGPYAYFDIKW